MCVLKQSMWTSGETASLGEKLGLFPAVQWTPICSVAVGKPLSLSGPDVTIGPFHTKWPRAQLLQWSRRRPHPPGSFLAFPPLPQRSEREGAGQPEERLCAVEGSALGLPAGILSWRFSRGAVPASLGISVLSPPNSPGLVQPHQE